MKHLNGPMIAIVLVVSAALVFAACGEKKVPITQLTTGEELFTGLGCARCHGAAGEGIKTGPPVLNMAKFWDEDTMVAFLKNPESFKQKDPRLMARSESYPIYMPPVTGATDEQLKTLSGFVLEMK